jgi:hypothetical protein
VRLGGKCSPEFKASDKGWMRNKQKSEFISSTIPIPLLAAIRHHYLMADCFFRLLMIKRREKPDGSEGSVIQTDAFWVAWIGQLDAIFEYISVKRCFLARVNLPDKKLFKHIRCYRDSYWHVSNSFYSDSRKMDAYKNPELVIKCIRLHIRLMLFLRRAIKIAYKRGMQEQHIFDYKEYITTPEGVGLYESAVNNRKYRANLTAYIRHMKSVIPSLKKEIKDIDEYWENKFTATGFTDKRNF